MSIPASAAPRLPAQRFDQHGRPHIDQHAILRLALPFMANSAIQIVLNLTDMWFVGRLSTNALAAVGAVQWLVLAVVLVLGGVGQAVQTLVAQAQGAGRLARASQAVWTAMWGMLCAIPLFAAVGATRNVIFAPFGFQPQIAQLAGAFWLPRISGASVAVAVWAVFGFFNGIGRPRMTLLVTIVVALANAVFNQWFIFNLGMGIAGSGWATTAAQTLGLLLALLIFLRPYYRERYKSHLTWHLHWGRLWQQLRLGMPMGLLPAADIMGFAVFQMMQTRLGVIGGAATQIVMMLTSVAYLPGYGIAAAGTTLVGQSIGAGDRQWGGRVGTRVILLTGLYMGGIGVVLALGGPWLLPLFTGAHDAEAAATVALSARLLWIAVCYQFFDGINMGSSQCLRGAGDVVVPTALVLPISWLIFMPLAHMLTFAPGDGWVHFLPQFGWGAVGGWLAVLVYIFILATALLLRWRSGAWRHIRLGVARRRAASS